MNTENLRLIERLFEAFNSGAATVTKPIINEFARQVDGRPISHVKRVVEKFIDGKIPGQSYDFPPSPAKFGNALLLEPYHGQEEQEWAKARITAGKPIALPQPGKPAEKMSARTAEGMRQLAASLKTPEEG